MTINIEEIIEKAFEKAFLRLLEQTIQAKVEARLKQAFEEEGDLFSLSERIEGLIDYHLSCLVEEEIFFERNETDSPKLDLTEGEHL